MPVQGLWVWRRKSIENEAAQNKLLAFAQEHGFNRILMQIHLKPAVEGTAKREIAMPDALRQLLAKASKAGIKVEALDGAKDMALKENWPGTLAVLDCILEFNRSQPVGERFEGMHYDIEPYIMPEWKTDERQSIMLEYLQYLEMARQRIANEQPRMLLSADIPMWYDHKVEPGDSCVIDFNGQTKNLHQHVQDLTDYIGIMSYRRKATGSNSVTYHIENEVAYAEKIGKFVCAALETVPLDDSPQITFYGQPAGDLWNTKREVEQTMAGRPGFGGMLIHSYDGLRNLIEKSAPAATSAAK